MNVMLVIKTYMLYKERDQNWGELVVATVSVSGMDRKRKGSQNLTTGNGQHGNNCSLSKQI